MFRNTALKHRPIFGCVSKHRPIGRCLESGIKTPPYFFKHRPIFLNTALFFGSSETPPYRAVFGNTALKHRPKLGRCFKHRPIGRCFKNTALFLKTPPYKAVFLRSNDSGSIESSDTSGSDRPWVGSTVFCCLPTTVPSTVLLYYCLASCDTNVGETKVNFLFS